VVRRRGACGGPAAGPRPRRAGPRVSVAKRAPCRPGTPPGAAAPQAIRDLPLAAERPATPSRRFQLTTASGSTPMPTAPPAPAPLIPRAKLFGNPTRAQGQIAPDGRALSWLAPKDGVLNLWVAPIEAADRARVISNDQKRGIRFYTWAKTSRHLLYLQDEGGSEDWHIYAVGLDG